MQEKDRNGTFNWPAFCTLIEKLAKMFSGIKLNAKNTSLKWNVKGAGDNIPSLIASGWLEIWDWEFKCESVTFFKEVFSSVLWVAKTKLNWAPRSEGSGSFIASCISLLYHEWYFFVHVEKWISLCYENNAFATHFWLFCAQHAISLFIVDIRLNKCDWRKCVK